MSSRPYMKLWVADFLGDTTALDQREIGAYMLLLMAMWQGGGSLSSDPVKLKRAARGGRDWPKVWEGIRHYFVEVDGRLTNKRLAEELHESDMKSQARSRFGVLGGKAKALKDKETGLAKDMAKAIASHSHSQKEERKSSDTIVSATENRGETHDESGSDQDIFRLGVDFLTLKGSTETRARSLVARWRKATGSDDAVRALMVEAYRGDVGDPVSWIEARAKAPSASKAPAGRRLGLAAQAAAEIIAEREARK